MMEEGHSRQGHSGCRGPEGRQAGVQCGGFVTGWFRYALWASGRSLGLILGAMGSLGRSVYGSDL